MGLLFIRLNEVVVWGRLLVLEKMLFYCRIVGGLQYTRCSGNVLPESLARDWSV